MLRTAVRMLLALVMAATALTAVAGPAQAANPYGPVEVCGPGYRVIHQGPVDTAGGVRYGTAYLLYKSGGYNCVVTIKSRWVGQATETHAVLLRDRERDSLNYFDRGNYKYYAVVKGYAPACVKFWGTMYPPGVTDYDRRGEAMSGWGWCD